MKNTLTIAVGILLCAALGAGAAVINDSLKVRFDHAVVVGETELPAGEYSIRQLELNGGTPALTIESVETGSRIFVPVRRCSTPNGEKAVRTELILGRENDQFRLAKIWLEGQMDGFEVIHSLPSVE